MRYLGAMNIRVFAKCLVAATICTAACTAALGESGVPQPAKPACPPDVSAPDAPTVGSAAPNLSDKLSQSKGIICPPAGVDPEIAVRPPPTGDTKVIPPPGSPGGDTTIQPK